MKVVIGALLAASVLGAGMGLAPAPVAPTTRPASDVMGVNPDPSRYLFEDEIFPGMKGYGLTVMHGGKIEKFDVEVIDVIRNFSPGNNAILVRCSGLGLEHSGIIAGMSGSPVFLQGKMIGAIAYGWGMSKDPIGGVQPIRQMLSIQTGKGEVQAMGRAGGARWASNMGLAREAAGLAGWRELANSLGKRVGGGSSIARFGATTVSESPEGLRPLVSPLMVGGVSGTTVEMLKEALAGTGLVPVASGSAGATVSFDTQERPIRQLGGIAELKPHEIQLEPGSAIAVPLVTGDMDLSAIGTVTEVRDGKVYAFGHSFIGEGTTQLPIATSYIYTIMPNVSQSFKMGTSIAADGTLVTDEQTGIVGVRGKAPATVPVVLHLKSGDGVVDKTYKYRLAPHPHLTPEMLSAILNETLIAQRTLPQQFTARLAGKMTFRGASGETMVRVDNLGVTGAFNPLITLLPVAVLSDNPFENLELTGVTVDASIENRNEAGTIQNVTVDRLTAAPGDEVTAMVDVAAFQQGVKRIPLTVKIPKDLEDGDYQLAVGSSQMAMMQEVNYAPQHFDPQSIGALTEAVQRILGYHTDHLYATLRLDVTGAAVAGREMKDLPASRIALYASDRRNDSNPVFNVARTEVEAGNVIADGGQVFVIHVDKEADGRYFEVKPKGPGAAGAGGRGGLKLARPPQQQKGAPADDSGD